ncbi:cryptochrome/photolyase family protein [bacterium]|nr:cryptochrome/photolyase family protein [bacterium]
MKVTSKAVKKLRFVLGDQLNNKVSSLADADPTHDVILMCEVQEEATYVKHHKKKLAFVFSVMRHFRDELLSQGFKVHYLALDDGQPFDSFDDALAFAVELYSPEQVVVTEPGEYRVLQKILKWSDKFGIDVDMRPDDRFLVDHAFFKRWSDERKEWRMEFFYREVRRSHCILMDNDKPEGGKWNYDAANRSSLSDSVNLPLHTVFEPDDISRNVMSLVSNRFGDNFGDIEPFYFATTRVQALCVLKVFIEERLPQFGDFQDAMKHEEPWLFHSHLSFYINCGLLLPLEVIRAAEASYYDHHAPLNCVEGFIRQIAGWREYVRAIYWHTMPDYAHENALSASRPLPDLYWTGKTKMHCLSQCVQDTQRNAYAHHIQRLMVLGNFALLCGLLPDEVNEWYLLVYADAYEWVELPNVSGMVLYADGGRLASKPYISGGNYINKMSDYCQHCHYSVTKKSGEKACPFNYLYWYFLIQHKDTLYKNPRLRMPYVTLSKMKDVKVEEIQGDAVRFLGRLDKHEGV